MNNESLDRDVENKIKKINFAKSHTESKCLAAIDSWENQLLFNESSIYQHLTNVFARCFRGGECQCNTSLHPYSIPAWFPRYNPDRKILRTINKCIDLNDKRINEAIVNKINDCNKQFPSHLKLYIDYNNLRVSYHPRRRSWF